MHPNIFSIYKCICVKIKNVYDIMVKSNLIFLKQFVKLKINNIIFKALI